MLSFGVNPARMVLPVHCRLPQDVFFPSRLIRRPGGVLRLVCYGKVGETKGTAQLLKAVDQCTADGLPIKLITHWGGRGMDVYRRNILETRLRHVVSWRGFVPHWRIADALRWAHVGVFLENRFGIPFHTPIGPLECWACGRTAILSEEIMRKDYIADIAVPGGNCFVAGGSPPGIRQLKRAIREAFEAVGSSPGTMRAPGAALFPGSIHGSTQRMLAEIGRRLP
jgi:glycosyltransferase involved in cell wall biosynthesis